MSNNISADLARFNGEIGPQYLDVEDKTGGPDGTMKPLTKEILREMIVTNFPELMNVSDETAQQKLDALDNKLQELDQKLMTLDEIKTQLEGTINTQLTGSIVEDVNGAQAVRTKQAALAYKSWFFDGEDTITLGAGASMQESEYTLVNGFSSLAVVIRDIGGSSEWALNARWGTDINPGTSQTAYESLSDTRNDPTNTDSNSIPTKGVSVRGHLVNSSSEERTYHVGFLLRV